MVRQEINPSKDFDYTYSLPEDSDSTLDDGRAVVFKKVNSKGRHFEPYERDVGAARHIKAGTINKYYIKADDTGELYDPTNTTHKTQASKFRNGNPLFYMHEVKANQFKSYMEFLKTKDKRFLAAARKDL